jgi:beta-fructofuranosidase
MKSKIICSVIGLFVAISFQTLGIRAAEVAQTTTASQPVQPQDRNRLEGAPAAEPKIPVIDGDYVLIYKPQPDVYIGRDTKNYRKGATYKDWQPNDHSFIKGPDNRWHLFGITRPNDVKSDGCHEGEELCFHAVAPVGTLEQAFRPQAWIDQPKLGVSDCGWAPVVVKIGDTYSIIGSHMGRAESKDLYKWEDKGRLAAKGGNRDPNIMLWNGAYHLVRCDNAVVSLAISTDFVHWSEPQEIFKARQASWNCESPTLLHHEGTFYLFWCLYDSAGFGADDPALYAGHNPATYTYRTYVYASETPTDFHGRAPLAELKAHAPEIVQDEQGNWFISSADYPQRGVNLARLIWKQR